MEYTRFTKKKLRDTDFSLVLDENNNVIVDRRLFERFIEQHNQLAELEDKIEQGTLTEFPCIIVGNGAIDAFGKVRVPYYQVLWLDEFGMLKIWKSTDKVEAEKRLKELQNG